MLKALLNVHGLMQVKTRVRLLPNEKRRIDYGYTILGVAFSCKDRTLNDLSLHSPFYLKFKSESATPLFFCVDRLRLRHATPHISGSYVCTAM